MGEVPGIVISGGGSQAVAGRVIWSWTAHTERSVGCNSGLVKTRSQRRGTHDLQRSIGWQRQAECSVVEVDLCHMKVGKKASPWLSSVSESGPSRRHIKLCLPEVIGNRKIELTSFTIVCGIFAEGLPFYWIIDENVTIYLTGMASDDLKGAERTHVQYAPKGGPLF